MNVLLVGCKENENSSKLVLDLITPKYYIDKLYLDTNLLHAKEQLTSQLQNKIYDYVFLFHMEEDKKEDTVHVRMFAEQGGQTVKTNYPIQDLTVFLQEHKDKVAICNKSLEDTYNEIYYTGLSQIYENAMDTRCVLMDLPVLSNMDVMQFSYHMIKYLNKASKVL